MASIDERIVRMKLDSTQFVKGAGLVVKALQLINQNLQMKNASKGFDAINKGANSVKLDGISSGLEQLNSRFSALGVMGMSVLNNIANAAVSAGQRILNEFIAPVSQGFEEYELQMNSVQTILANTQSKGTTLDQVNGALNELNTYADKTIYNFAEMTRNIGTFTAAGVDLDTSVASIKGLANLAAASGSSATQAATAMYQLSQAIAAGRVSLMDWNSVVNAGMGGELFQNALIRTSEQLNTGAEAAIKKYGSFRESLTQGEWLTTQVLTETLKQISGAYTEADLIAQGYSESQAKEILQLAQTAEDAATKVKTFTQLIDTTREALGSGWAQTWQIIFGDFEEAKELWTGVSEVITGAINDMSQSRNDMLQGWSDLGGRTKLIEGLGDAFKALGKIVETVSQAFENVFPPITSQQLMDLTEGFADFAKNMMISDETADKLRRTFEGVFSIFSIGFKVIKALAKGFVDVVDSVLDLGSGFLDATANIGDYIRSVDQAVDSTNIFQKIVDTVTDLVRAAVDILKDLGSVVAQVFDSIRKGIDGSGVAESFDSMVESFSKADTINGFADVLVGAFRKIVEFFGPALESLSQLIGDALGLLGDFVTSFLSDVDVQSLLELINTGLLGGILKGVYDFVKNFGEKVDDFETIGQTFKSVIGTVQSTLESFQGAVDVVKLPAIAGAIALLADALVTISKIDEDALYDALSVIAAMFVELMLAMKAFSKINPLSLGGVTSLAFGVLAIAGAVRILAESFKIFSAIDVMGLVQSLGTIQVLIIEMASAMMMFGGISAPTIKASAALIMMAAAFDLLVPAVVALSKIDVIDLCKAISGLGAVMLEFAGVMMMLGNVKMGIDQASGFVIMVAAIDLLVPALAVLSMIDVVDLCKAISGLGAVMLELAGVIMMFPDSGKMVLAGAGLIAISTAIIGIAGAMKIMATMSWDETARGLLSFTTALMGLTVVLLAMPDGGKAAAVGAGLLIAASAIVVLAGALKILASMSIEDLAKGIIAISGALVEVSVTLGLMKSNLGGAASLVVAAGALVVFAGAMKMFSSLGWEGITVALVGIAGAIAVVAVSAHLLSGMIPVFAAAAGAMALFGAGMALIGAGLLAAGAGLAGFATSGVAAAAGIEAVFKAIIGLIPDFIDGVVDGLVSAMSILTEGAPAIAEGITAVLVSLLDSFNILIPKLAEVLINVVDEALKSLATHIPSIGNSLFDILIGVIDVVASRAPELVESLSTLVSNILTAAFGDITNFDLQDIADLFIAVTGFGAIFVALGALKTSIKNGTKAALMMAIGLGALGGVFVLLANFTPEDALEKATAMSETFIAIGAVMKIVSTIPLGAAIQGIGSLATAVGGITAIIAAMGGIAQIPGFDWLISEGTEALKGVGGAIGGFVGSIVGSAIESISDSFPAIGTNLSQFMENLEPFFESASSMPEGASEAVASVAGAVLALTTSDILDGIKTWATGGEGVDFSKFGEKLVDFGGSIGEFAKKVKGLDLSGVQPAMEALKIIAQAAMTIPNSGGAWGGIVGNNDLDDFGAKMQTFAPQLKEFCDNVIGLDTSGVQPAMDALKIISEAAKTIPNTGGAAGFWAGNNDLDTIGGMLESFSLSMKAFVDNINGIDTGELTTAVNALQTMINITNAVQVNNSGGVFSSGELDGLSETMGAMSKLGESLASFASQTAGKDFTGVEPAAQAIQKVAYWIGQTKNFDGTGIKSLKETIENLGDLGLAKFNESLGNLCTQVNTKMIALNEAVTNQSSALALALQDLRTQIESKAGGLGGILSVQIQAMVDAVSGRSGDFTTAFSGISNSFDTFRTQMASKLDEGKDTIRSKLNQAIFTINGFQSQFRTEGSGLADALVEGIKSSVSANDISSAFSGALSSGLASIREYRSSFRAAGGYVGSGFAEGIRASINNAAVAAAQMASAASEAARANLDINSPSKVFRSIGNSTGEGFVMGINDGQSDVWNAASNLAGSATKGMQSAISALSRRGSLTPTIAPVLDMTKTGRSMISTRGVLDGATLGIKGLSLSNVRGDEIEMMDQYYQKIQNSNAQVASAIADLRGDMSTYNRELANQETAVYVDGKKLASSIAKPMNQQLGIRSRRGSLSRV